MTAHPNEAAPYYRLDPDTVLHAVDSTGLRTDGRLLALNSYENRVYQVGIEDDEPVVAKFYRPGRWSDEQILEEHGFSLEHAAAEIPLVAVRPDLRLVRLEFVPARPVVGDSLAIRVHVGNEGVGRSGPTELVLRVGAETEGASYPVGPMEPGSTLVVERRLLLEQPQFYQVLAFVDPRNVVPEFINTNNAAIGLIEVSPAPRALGR